MTGGANDMPTVRKVVKKGKGGSHMNVFQPSIQGVKAQPIGQPTGAAAVSNHRARGSNLNVINTTSMRTPQKQAPERLNVPSKFQNGKTEVPVAQVIDTTVPESNEPAFLMGVPLANERR